ncbi:restriction endonuclease subunit S [Aequorivita viscosa]|uniref:Type I restriction enzyme, S subunit n=1 Tax=Aequorivita viscosa TaxID=797419 RepID=A0A1M6JK29_9FLAO|nr:restriction endonuclease subunit S [Aequorivita viscosa]SDX11871.1 type I restriction enzyme, S subunit [Aequorivita viscosa]SHJ47026.1 type I restriction enzyme, S subunit [Aequorivita viscosa]
MSAISATISLSSIGEKSFTIKEGYKKTKLGWIPEDWETPRIDEVFDFLSSNSLSRNQLNYEEEEGVYNIHYGDIHATYKRPILDFENESRVPKINKEIAISQTSDFLKDGDLVVADASEDYEGVGEAIELKNVNERKVISGLHTFAFRDKTNKTAEGFRVYIFRNPLVKKALKTIATGSKVYGISKGNLQKFKIVLPTLPEQQKIATILSTWDSAIAKQEQLITAKQEFKKGLMQLLLTGKKRFEGFEGEWKAKKLKDLGEVFTGGTPSSEVEDYWGGEITWYTPSEIRGAGKYIQKSRRKITLKGLKNSSATIFPKNTIVICTRATIGELAISKVEACTNQGFKSLNVNENNEVEFIYYKLKQSKTIFMRKASGSTFLELSTTDFRNLILKMPPLPEQQKIASVLSAADKEIGLLQSELARLRGQKRGLMQRLLTGEKRVKIKKIEL